MLEEQVLLQGCRNRFIVVPLVLVLRKQVAQIILSVTFHHREELNRMLKLKALYLHYSQDRGTCVQHLRYLSKFFALNAQLFMQSMLA